MVLMAVDVSLEDGSLAVRRLLEGFVDRVLEGYPGLTGTVLRSSCLALTDAVAFWELLDASDEPVEVLDVGAFFGVSTFLFASHRAVRQVISVDRSSALSDRLGEDPLKVQGVVRSVLADFPEAASKMRFSDEAARTGTEEGSVAPRFDLATLSPADETMLLGFVDGNRTSEEVFADLLFLFSARPESLVFLQGCRHGTGPFVQAGVARFLTSHPQEYTFQLLADLSPGLGASNLGAMYLSTSDGALPERLGYLVESLSNRFDPLRQLEREQELIARVLTYRRERDEARWAMRGMRQSISWRLTAPLRKLNRRSRHTGTGPGFDGGE
jgi:hypothetical protein